MMDKGIRSADDTQSRLFYADRVIVILKHADAEPLIERADALIDVPAHCDAEHCQHVNVGYLSVVRSHEITCKLFHLGPRLVVDLNPRFVAKNL